MKISIIIPVFNVSLFIERCLLSALNQSYEKVEVILVDDRGSDNSMELAQRILNSHHRGHAAKIVKHKKNRGLSAARNSGVDAATGQYIYFLDSDDELTPNCIEILAQAAIEFTPDFIIGNYTTIGSDEIYPPLKLCTGSLTSNSQILTSYLNHEWYMMAWNKLVNKPFFVKNQLYFKDGLIHEDNLWSFQLACKAQSAFVVSDITYCYHIQRNSITQKPSERNYESYVEIIQSMADFVVAEELKLNDEIYNFIETLKSYFFNKINSSKLSNQKKYNAYKKVRKCNYRNAYLYFIHYKLNKRQIRIKLHSRLLVHYMLPTRIGYLRYKRSLFRIYQGRV